MHYIVSNLLQICFRVSKCIIIETQLVDCQFFAREQPTELRDLLLKTQCTEWSRKYAVKFFLHQY